MLKSLFAAVLIAVPVAGEAMQVTLTPASVVANSGAYGAQFAANNILDQQTGAIVEPVQANYWINNDNGPATAFITVDLGATYTHLSFQLFNTHNAQYNDRGTGSFTLTGGSSAAGATGTTLVSGTLTAEAGLATVLTAQSFTSADAGGFRFIRFNPNGVAVGGSPCCGSNVYGLNELRVFGSTVPEPATWGLMLTGFAMTGFVARRRVVTIAA